MEEYLDNSKNFGELVDRNWRMKNKNLVDTEQLNKNLSCKEISLVQLP